MLNNNCRRINSRASRTGAAAIETALVLPVLVLITLGSVDISQYINLNQLVTNASREGARIASKNTTKSRSEVEDAITTFLFNAFPNISEEGFSEAVYISVQDSSGNEINDSDDGNSMSDLQSGEQLTVEVWFDFAAVRWLNGPDYWNGNSSQCLTVTRRE